MHKVKEYAAISKIQKYIQHRLYMYIPKMLYRLYLYISMYISVHMNAKALKHLKTAQRQNKTEIQRPVFTSNIKRQQHGNKIILRI